MSSDDNISTLDELKRAKGGGKATPKAAAATKTPNAETPKAAAATTKTPNAETPKAAATTTKTPNAEKPPGSNENKTPEPEKPNVDKPTNLRNGNIFLASFKKANEAFKKIQAKIKEGVKTNNKEATKGTNNKEVTEDQNRDEAKETKKQISVYETLRKYHLVREKEENKKAKKAKDTDTDIGKSEKAKQESKKAKQEKEKAEKKRKETIQQRLDKIGEELKRLCKKRKEVREGKGDKDKNLKVINRHIKHLAEEEEDLKKHHKKDKYENDNETAWERFRRISSSETAAAFVLFCTVSVFIFTLTAFYASVDPTYKDQSTHVKNILKSNLYTGIGYFAMFILLLSISFGKDKDWTEKIVSFVLLSGAIFVGLFFSFLNSQGKLTDLTKTEQLTVSIATATTFIFIFFCIYYELFEKGNGKIDNILRTIYLFGSLLLFWFMGSMMTYLTFSSKYGQDKGLKLMFPLSTGLFFAGILATLTLLLSYFKSVDEAINVPLNTALNLVEWFRFKIIILACFILSIYYTYLLYRANQTEKDPKNKFKIKKNPGLVNAIEKSLYAGVGFISFFLLILGICFGGTLEERLFATFLIVFVVFVGSLTLWLDGEDKITGLDKSEENILKATEVIFCILTAIAIWYVLFKAKTSEGKTLTTLARIIINFGAVVFFLYVFGLLCAAYGEFNFKRELDIFPNKHEKLSIELFTGICVGILAIIISIAIII